MAPNDYTYLKGLLRECETNPDLTLFLMDEAAQGEPWIQIPLGEDPTKDGFLILHDDGWFIQRD